MKIKVYQDGGEWVFAIKTANNVTIAHSDRLYASRRNAIAAANLLAKNKLKVVVEE